MCYRPMKTGVKRLDRGIKRAHVYVRIIKRSANHSEHSLQDVIPNIARTNLSVNAPLSFRVSKLLIKRPPSEPSINIESAITAMQEISRAVVCVFACVHTGYPFSA